MVRTDCRKATPRKIPPAVIMDRQNRMRMLVKAILNALDHGSSICTVYTVQGMLSADNYRKSTGGHIRADYSEDFKPGSVLSIQTTEIHQVSNLQASSDLVSLHFYLSPLENNFVYSVMQPTFEVYRPGYTRVFMHADGI